MLIVLNLLLVCLIYTNRLVIQLRECKTTSIPQVLGPKFGQLFFLGGIQCTQQFDLVLSRGCSLELSQVAANTPG